MNDLQAVENRILDFLRGRVEPQDPAQLVSELAGETQDLEEVRRAIWHLVGRKRVEFTRDWKLRVVPDSELVPA